MEIGTRNEDKIGTSNKDDLLNKPNESDEEMTQDNREQETNEKNRPPKYKLPKQKPTDQPGPSTSKTSHQDNKQSKEKIPLIEIKKRLGQK